MDGKPTRYTLRDLPVPAKLVVSAFLISVGIGYLWAMAQIHFKHASPGHPMPTTADLVTRFSGVPWPLPKPEPEPDPKKQAEAAKNAAPGEIVHAVKVKELIKNRCVWCHGKDGEKEEIPLGTYDDISKFLARTTDHPKGQLHTVLTGSPKNWNKKSMVKAFFEKSADWEDLTPDARKQQEPQRHAERQALVAWAEAGAPKAQYEADAFPLPRDFPFDNLPAALKTNAPDIPRGAAAAAEPKAADKWKEAKLRQLSVDALTQSTHAHLLTFSLLWAATGLVLAFSSYRVSIRTLLAPLVLVAQVIDVGCWWLARLEPPAGPYFALAIMATGTVVGLGLAAQIVLSLWDMYGAKGRFVLVLLFLIGAGLFGLTYVKVIEPQLQAERALQAGNGD
ncbi:MAG TPA: hypothetical protein VKD90_04290 [Gemmataceae bacterium]|nr:hypothetical protein [Gemmataceae bacterium]